MAYLAKPNSREALLGYGERRLWEIPAMYCRSIGRVELVSSIAGRVHNDLLGRGPLLPRIKYATNARSSCPVPFPARNRS
jgi:hypothetical protein